VDRAAFRVIGGSLQDDDAFAVGRDIVMRQGPVRIDWSFGKQALHLSAIFRSKTTDTPSYRLRLSGRPDYLIERPKAWSLSSSNPARVPALDRMPLMWRS